MTSRFKFRLFSAILSLFWLVLTPLPVYGRRSLNLWIDCVFEVPTRWIRHTFFPTSPDYDGFFTDSINYAVLLGFGVLLSTLVYVLIRFVNSQIYTIVWFNKSILIYLLAWIFLVYGFSKILGNQFPDLATLEIEKRDENKDLLFWAWMGANPLLVYVIGLMEIGIGLSLLFKKSRKIGLIAFLFAVLGILTVNLIFDIGVVIFSMVLLFAGATALNLEKRFQEIQRPIPENIYKSMKLLVILWILILAGFHSHG